MLKVLRLSFEAPFGYFDGVTTQPERLFAFDAGIFLPLHTTEYKDAFHPRSPKYCRIRKIDLQRISIFNAP